MGIITFLPFFLGFFTTIKNLPIEVRNFGQLPLINRVIKEEISNEEQTKFHRIITLVITASALIALAGCDNGTSPGKGSSGSGGGGGGGGSASVTYVSEDADNIYQLTVTSKSTSSKSIAYSPDTALNVSYATGVASYTPKAGDTFVLFIIVKGATPTVKESHTGTITTEGATITLTTTSSTTITVTTSSDTMTKIKIGTTETTLTAVQPSDAGKTGTSGSFKYKINSDGLTATITGWEGNLTTGSIPALITKKPVTAIGERAFQECTSLTSVTIPASVTKIGDGAFNVTNLTSVTFATGSNISNANFGKGAFGPLTEDYKDDYTTLTTLKTAYLTASSKAGTYTFSSMTWTKQ
jgi:hypothetical protein